MKMSGFKCSVSGCNSVIEKHGTIQFHAFPPKGRNTVSILNKSNQFEEVDLRKAWIERLDIEKNIVKHAKVCSKHFTLEDYYPKKGTGQKIQRLKKNAVPSLHLPSDSRVISIRSPTKRERLVGENLSLDYISCFIPTCLNSTLSTPSKVFLNVPNLTDELRVKWCSAIGVDRKFELNCSKTICEDHFNLQNDLQNYKEWKVSKVKPKLKSTVIPHRSLIINKNNKNNEKCIIPSSSTQLSIIKSEETTEKYSSILQKQSVTNLKFDKCVQVNIRPPRRSKLIQTPAWMDDEMDYDGIKRENIIECEDFSENDDYFETDNIEQFEDCKIEIEYQTFIKSEPIDEEIVSFDEINVKQETPLNEFKTEDDEDEIPAKKTRYTST